MGTPALLTAPNTAFVVWGEQQVTVGTCHDLYLQTLQFIGTGGARTRDADKYAAVIAHGKVATSPRACRQHPGKMQVFIPSKGVYPWGEAQNGRTMSAPCSPCRDMRTAALSTLHHSLKHSVLLPKQKFLCTMTCVLPLLAHLCLHICYI